MRRPPPISTRTDTLFPDTPLLRSGSAWRLIRDSARILLDKVPRGVEVPAVEERLLAVDGVAGVHDVHVWTVTRSEEHTSELQSLMRSSYAVFCLKKKNHITIQIHHTHLHLANTTKIIILSTS